MASVRLQQVGACQDSPCQYNRAMPAASLLYSASQVRALDGYAIAQGTSGYTLMKRAGEAALRALRFLERQGQQPQMPSVVPG